MTRDQKIKIAMVICATVLLCAVIITSTGMLNTTGIGGYANADQYTAGTAEITETVKNLPCMFSLPNPASGGTFRKRS